MGSVRTLLWVRQFLGRRGFWNRFPSGRLAGLSPLRKLALKPRKLAPLAAIEGQGRSGIGVGFQTQDLADDDVVVAAGDDLAEFAFEPG